MLKGSFLGIFLGIGRVDLREIFLGVDFSSINLAKKGKTVAVILSHKDKAAPPRIEESVRLENNEEFIDFLRLQSFSLCGVDAPLSLPPCLFCQRTHCDCPLVSWTPFLGISVEDFYHYRLSDILIRRAIPPLMPKPALSNGGPVDITPLALRWLHLSRMMKRQDLATDKIIEVYSSGAIPIYAKNFGMGDTAFRYRSSPQERERLLTKILDSSIVTMTQRHLFDLFAYNEDAFDALFAALTTWQVAQGKALLPSQLLSLTPSPPWIRQLEQIPLNEREKMTLFLKTSNWTFLPIPPR